MEILVLNVGSSSIKYKVYRGEKVVLSGKVERIKDKKGYERGMQHIFEMVENEGIRIDVIGHRVVHGKLMERSCVINKSVLKKIEEACELAPLHNVPELFVIRYCMKYGVKNVAVFDTAFHSTMPQKAHMYALPYKLYKEGIRRYGFHGTSHKYVVSEAEKIVGKGKKLITCHLGNGCSVTAVSRGKSVDNSLGFTPLEGIMMGTRSGNVDPAIIPYLIGKKKYKNAQEVVDMLNNESGLLGISGKGSDIRDVVFEKVERSKLAIEMFCYSIAKCVGGYAAVLNGVDAIVFTGGIGEHVAKVRRKVLEYFGYLGVKVDAAKNKANNKVISAAGSKVKVLVVPTDEELMIARETKKLV